MQTKERLSSSLAVGDQPVVSNWSPTSVAALAFLGDERAPRIARSISSGARWPRSEVIDDVVGGILIAASMGSNWLCRHCTRTGRARIDVRGSRGKHASPLLGVVRRGYMRRPEGVEAHFRLLCLFLLLLRSCGGRLQLARARQRAVQRRWLMLLSRPIYTATAGSPANCSTSLSHQ